MISSNKNAANAFGGKTARACDSCLKKRARWYYAADDAFLCQACDSSVHSANPLACRHERVRLKTASLKSLSIIEPSWLHGFTRKARTPRHGKAASQNFKIEDKFNSFVPEFGSDEISVEDNNEEEEQLLYRVPVFDSSFVGDQLCTSTTTTTISNGIQCKDVESLHGFLDPLDMDLADCAADVESLLGRGLKNESFRMEELGSVDCKEEELLRYSLKEEKKEEFDECHHVDSTEIDMAKEPPFELSFEYDSPTCREEDEKVEREMKKEDHESEKRTKKKKRKILLSLDYESVITAWSTQGCPWTTGNRPEFDQEDECWPHWMGNWEGQDPIHGYGGINVMAGGGGGGGREARVSRYREKRRTRLFSKKIRYQVRKLNAEKRPRMKGRFVKRATSLH